MAKKPKITKAMINKRWLTWMGIIVVVLAFSAFIINHRSKTIGLDARGQRVMVVVAHPDDAVIIAGAYCYETVRQKGRVRIVFSTDGEVPNDPRIGKLRRAEALAAWKLAGVLSEDITFLRNDNFYGLQKPEDVAYSIDQLTRIIKIFKPDILITSSYENGNYQHDVTNYAVWIAFRRSGIVTRLLEAPEYNFYISITKTPAKILQAISRLIPFFEYHAPPQFIRDGPIYEFLLSDSLHSVKKQMLTLYHSQNVAWLLDYFNHNERFQDFNGHDYFRPPFVYGRFMSSLIEISGHFPWLRQVQNRIFGSMSPVHPTIDHGTFHLGQIIESASGLAKRYSTGSNRRMITREFRYEYEH